MDIQLFNSPQFGQIRTSGTPSEPIFCASDVCRALGYSNGRKAISDHCEEGDVTKRDTPTSSGTQLMTFVNESGLYALIFGSKLDSARQFKKWVTSEVLPSIRENGGYIHAKEVDTPEEIMAKAVLLAQKTIESQKQKLQILEGKNALLQQENQELTPKAQYADDVLQSNGTYTNTEMAKELNFRSWTTFVDACKKDGILFKHPGGMYMLYAKFAGKGYMKTRTNTFSHKDGTIGTSVISVWTEEGRRFLHEHFNVALHPVDLTMFPFPEKDI